MSVMSIEWQIELAMLIIRHAAIFGQYKMSAEQLLRKNSPLNNF